MLFYLFVLLCFFYSLALLFGCRYTWSQLWDRRWIMFHQCISFKAVLVLTDKLFFSLIFLGRQLAHLHCDKRTPRQSWAANSMYCSWLAPSCSVSHASECSFHFSKVPSILQNRLSRENVFHLKILLPNSQISHLSVIPNYYGLLWLELWKIGWRNYYIFFNLVFYKMWFLPIFSFEIISNTK